MKKIREYETLAQCTWCKDLFSVTIYYDSNGHRKEVYAGSAASLEDDKLIHRCGHEAFVIMSNKLWEV